MKTSSTDSSQQMQTLSQCMAHATRQGYTESFKVIPQGLATEDGSIIFTPERVRIENFYRFEGYSDPGDNSVLYLIATDTDIKGILLDAYDAYADAAISEFVTSINAITKKPHEQHSIMRSLKRLFRF